MAASSQVCHNKRARNEYWNGGLAFPDAKKIRSIRSVHDSYLTALLEKIDNMDADSKETHAVMQVQEDERGLIGVMKFAEDERELIGRVAVIDEKGGAELGSMQHGELSDSYSEAISVSNRLGDMHSEVNFTYYVDLVAELGFFLYNTAGQLGVTLNLFDGDSTANMYSDTVYGYAETPADSYGSLWEDDIWQLNETTVFQNGFERPGQEEFGNSGVEFRDIWNDFNQTNPNSCEFHCEGSPVITYHGENLP